MFLSDKYFTESPKVKNKLCLSDSFVFSVLHKSSSIPIAVANDRLSVLIALPTFSRAYEALTCFDMLSVLTGEILID